MFNHRTRIRVQTLRSDSRSTVAPSTDTELVTFFEDSDVTRGKRYSRTVAAMSEASERLYNHS